MDDRHFTPATGTDIPPRAEPDAAIPLHMLCFVAVLIDSGIVVQNLDGVQHHSLFRLIKRHEVRLRRRGYRDLKSQKSKAEDSRNNTCQQSCKNPHSWSLEIPHSLEAKEVNDEALHEYHAKQTRLLSRKPDISVSDGHLT